MPLGSNLGGGTNKRKSFHRMNGPNLRGIRDTPTELDFVSGVWGILITGIDRKGKNRLTGGEEIQSRQRRGEGCS